MSRRSVLVTGSNGFIGRHLMQGLLRLDHRVLGVDEKPINYVPRDHQFEECDILDKERLCRIVNSFRPDVVFHLAARTDLDEKKDLGGYAVNIQGTENVLAAIHESRTVARAVFTSSKAVYDGGKLPPTETEFAPASLYGKSKALMEERVRDRDGGGAVWCLVRPTTVWGPGVQQHYQRFFRMIARGRYVHVGRRRLPKSYGFVGNVVHQYLQLMEAPAERIHRQVFYLSDYEMIDHREWVEAFRKEFEAPPIWTVPEWCARLVALMGDCINLIGFRDYPLNSFRLNNALATYQLDLSRTAKVCGPLPYTIEEGVRMTVQWMKREGLV